MSNTPKAIGIIMDGNRRWAKEQGKKTLEGHKAGLDKAKEVTRWAHDAGISEVTLYAFSTENWQRAEEEVKYLLGLIDFAFDYWFDEFIAEGGRLRIIGERERLPEKLRVKIEEGEKKSEAGTAGTLVLALSYGGRAEILAAVNELLIEGREQVTEEELREKMWSAGLMDPDLIIRTSGEHRLSNFLTWQSVYSELFFVDTYWPAFSKEEFDAILEEYASRERRHGK